jgi:hypothetical protein
MAKEVEEMKKKVKASEKKATKWKSRALDIARLAAKTPHGAFEGSHGVLGDFQGAGRGDTVSRRDSDSEGGLEGEEDEGEDDEELRGIWHAAFNPVKVPPSLPALHARHGAPPGGVVYMHALHTVKWASWGGEEAGGHLGTR